VTGHAGAIQTVYDQRNAIVHGRTPEGGRPTTQELDERRAPLFEFVLDLLAADAFTRAADDADDERQDERMPS
jgi:hypothetical protein